MRTPMFEQSICSHLYFLFEKLLNTQPQGISDVPELNILRTTLGLAHSAQGFNIQQFSLSLLQATP